MADITVDVQVYCAKCGAGICGNVTNGRKIGTIEIEPCERCLKTEADKRYQEGYDEGYDEGIKDTEREEAKDDE
jgi:hypothetical protein